MISLNIVSKHQGYVVWAVFPQTDNTVDLPNWITERLNEGHRHTPKIPSTWTGASIKVTLPLSPYFWPMEVRSAQKGAGKMSVYLFSRPVCHRLRLANRCCCVRVCMDMGWQRLWRRDSASLDTQSRFYSFITFHFALMWPLTNNWVASGYDILTCCVSCCLASRTN